MDKLYIDVETYCDLDLKEVGVHKYAAHPSFKILLLGYAYNFGSVVVAQEGNIGINSIRTLLNDQGVMKIAHNAPFEIACLKAAGLIKEPVNLASWICTSVMCRQQGLPPSLAVAATDLKLMEQKDNDGKRLIRLFCKPKKDGSRNTRETHPDEWKAFMAYNIQDVLVERALYEKLAPVGFQEHALWELDQKINDGGVKIDAHLAEKAVEMAAVFAVADRKQLAKATGLDKPTDAAVKKLYGIDTLSAKNTEALLDSRPELADVIALRNSLSKTSTKKFEAMLACAGEDHRARGLTQFYGAGRTGRWSGRLIQLQNLPRIKLNQNRLYAARQAVKHLSPEEFMIMYGDESSSVLSQLVRTAIVPEDGCKFVVADFSSIEARILAWLAGETWRLDVFNGDGKIYEASASRMFGIPIDKITKDHPARQKGKVAELALGYGGSVAALINMGAYTMGLKEEDLQPMVYQWRRANANITTFWATLDSALRAALDNTKPVPLAKGLKVYIEHNILTIELPSKRKLRYRNAWFDGKEIKYSGTNQTTGAWQEQKLYGAKAAENVVQAVARDCLADILVKAEKSGVDIVFHVHDEVICEVEEGKAEDVRNWLDENMKRPAVWAPGLPLKGESFICDYYCK